MNLTGSPSAVPRLRDALFPFEGERKSSRIRDGTRKVSGNLASCSALNSCGVSRRAAPSNRSMRFAARNRETLNARRSTFNVERPFFIPHSAFCISGSWRGYALSRRGGVPHGG